MSEIPEAWILWSVAEIAAYLGKGRSTVYRYMAQPDFPAAQRPGGGHPRWYAVAVKEWAARQFTPKHKLTG